MKYSDDTFSTDDKCFLFLNLKIDPSLFHRLPLELAPGIYLALTPQHALVQAAGKWANDRENIALAEWVYPGYGLGMGIVNACIQIDTTVSAVLRDRYFWFIVEALYLTKPLYMNIAGGFCYGNEEDGFLGRTPSKIGHRSNISLNTFFSHAKGENLLQYNEEDFKQAGVYFAHFVKIFNSRQTAPRPYFILKAFFEATLWEQSIYASTSFSKLFPLIDAFAGNPTHKHDKQTSKRLSLFLKEVPSVLLDTPLSEEAIRLRILSIWHLHRAPDLHGYLKEPDLIIANVPPQAPIDKPELKDLFDLMEFSRVSIIKMLMLDDESFEEYCQIPIPRRKYRSDTERTDADKARESASKKFFEEKTYSSPKSMFAYTDFVDQSEPDIAEGLPAKELTLSY